MKKIIVTIGLMLNVIVTSPAPAGASTVFCVNCSNWFTQALERATSLSQLTELATQTNEQIQQTVQQIELVKNAIQNTLQLPERMRGQLSSQLTELARRTLDLNTYRGEQTALAQVFNSIYPEQSTFASLTKSDQAGIEAANRQYQAHYDRWSKTIDDASQATFQLSGSQLRDLADSGGLQDYINNLLQTPEGQMQAIQSGNQLAALQLQEARQFRELMATRVQSDITGQMKAEKDNEWMKEQWKAATKTDKLKMTDRRDEPL